MKIEVDFDVCAASGTCARLAPKVFEVRPDGFLYVLIEEPPEEFHEAVRAAYESCPTAAITLIED
jgi:ferredoxin